MNTQVVILQRFSNVLRVLSNFLANGTNFHLHRSEPERKCSRIVLDQNAEKALHGSEERAVHHQRLMLGAVFGDVLQAEARGQVEVELHSGQLPGPTDGINQLDVYLWPVKGSLADNRFVGD